MPGLYVVTTRAPGTLITQLIYNSDHQNHVDGRTATEMGSYGISLSQFQLTEDPLPGGSVASLPPSLAGELTRLRFVMAQIKGQLQGSQVGNWYDQLNAPAFPTIGARVRRVSTLSIPDSTVTPISFAGGVVDYNTDVGGTCWSNSVNPTRFKSSSGGKYLAFGYAQFGAAVAGIRRLLIGVNGVFNDYTVVGSTEGANSAQDLTVSGIVRLNPTDYVEIAAYQDSGGAINLSVNAIGGIIFLGSN